MSDKPKRTWDQPIPKEERDAKERQRVERQRKKDKERNLQTRYNWLQHHLAYNHWLKDEAEKEEKYFADKIAEYQKKLSNLQAERAAAPARIPTLKADLERLHAQLYPDKKIDTVAMVNKAIKLVRDLAKLKEQMKDLNITPEQIALLQKSIDLGSNAGQEQRV